MLIRVIPSTIYFILKGCVYVCYHLVCTSTDIFKQFSAPFKSLEATARRNRRCSLLRLSPASSGASAEAALGVWRCLLSFVLRDDVCEECG